jgi:hypothetical protein
MTAAEFERRWARPVAIASICGAVLFLAGLVLQATLSDLKDDATTLTSFHDHRTGLLAGTILLGVGALLFSAPLYYLLRAAKARNPTIRSTMLAFAFIGPALIAGRAFLLWFAIGDVADKFVGGADQSADAAKALLDDSGLYTAVTTLGLPTLLGLLVATIYIPLMAMRVGLLTRFWGTLAIALGATSVLIGPVAFIGLGFWFLYVGLLVGGWLPSGRPPAWAAGEAIPWPTRDRQGVLPPPPDDAVEGTGREIETDEAPDGDLASPTTAPSPGGSAGEAEQPPANEAPRRKRKRRD